MPTDIGEALDAIDQAGTKNALEATETRSKETSAEVEAARDGFDDLASYLSGLSAGVLRRLQGSPAIAPGLFSLLPASQKATLAVSSGGITRDREATVVGIGLQHLMTGEEVLGQRETVPVRSGARFVFSWRIFRHAVSEDPSGDAVEVRARFCRRQADGSLALISDALVASYTDAALGVITEGQTRAGQVTYSDIADAETGALAWPDGTTDVCVYVETYGGAHKTAVPFLSYEDATNYAQVSLDVSTLQAAVQSNSATIDNLIETKGSQVQLDGVETDLRAEELRREGDLAALLEALDERDGVKGFALAFRDAITQALLGGFTDTGRFAALGLELIGGTADARRELGQRQDFLLMDKVTKQAWMQILDGRLGLAAFDIYGVTPGDGRDRGSPYVATMGLNGKAALMFRDDGHVEVSEPYFGTARLGPEKVHTFNLRTVYGKTRFQIGQINDRGMVYEVRYNSGAIRPFAPIMQHDAGLWSLYKLGQSTAGASGDDPDVPPIGGAAFKNCYEPGPAEQAYGDEGGVGAGVASITADDVSWLEHAKDNGWQENYPVTLLMWATEAAYRWHMGQPTPGQVGWTVNQGASIVERFLVGTSNYENESVYFDALPDLPGQYGRAWDKTLDVSFVQGENSSAGYAALLLQKKSEIETKAAAAGFGKVNFFVAVVNLSDADTANEEARIQQSVLAKNGDVLCSGPMYHAPLADNIHPNQHGDVRVAATEAFCRLRARLGMSTDYFWTASRVISGSTVVISYNIPDFCSYVYFNTTDVPAVPDYGFNNASDGTGALAITDVSITADNEITITFDRAIDAGFSMDYAGLTMDASTSGWSNGMGNVFVHCNIPHLFAGRMLNGLRVPEFTLVPALPETITA